jgi:hypothetical protein
MLDLQIGSVLVQIFVDLPKLIKDACVPCFERYNFALLH